MRKRTKMSASLAVACTMLGAVALSVSAALPAQAAPAAPAAPADYQPNANDIVGVGSDTLQYLVDFGASGDVSGDSGYNAAGNLYKLVSLDATADSNSRFAYLNGSTNAALLPLNPTVVIRAGTYPILRPNGSGNGINALLADTALADPHIDFARMSSNPTTAEGATAVTNGWQGLQQFVAGIEHLQIAADNTTNSPAGLSIQQLVKIYECDPSARTWSQVGGTSTANIIPDVPQTGSGTYNTFAADLKAGNGGVAVVLGGCVIFSEENDPTAITGNASPANVLEPMSSARLNLWSGLSGNVTFGSNPGTGYFHDPTVAYPGGAVLIPGVHELTGTPSDGNPFYNDTRNLNVVYRWTDQISSTAWQPGGTLNWAQTLFCDPGGPTPFFQTPAGKTLIAEAGFDPSVQSCLSAPLT